MRTLRVAALTTLFAAFALCQTPADSTNAAPHVDKHVLGIIPNFRTQETPAVYTPITTREKFRIAAQDSFDRGTIALAALFAGQSMLSGDNRSFGTGVGGYSKYLGAAYADFVIGNYMTEGIFPTVLHQDPRYFRRGQGSGASRLVYSVGQIFLTRRDSGRRDFNYSEIFGNATGVAISNLYYKDQRTAHDAVTQLSLQVGVDMATNIVKEFWPDFDRRFRRKHSTAADAAGRH
jgi:hypothetical protein